MGPVLLPVLNQQRVALGNALADPATDADLTEMLTEELALVEKAIAAPSQPFVSNFDAETEQEVVHPKKPIGLPLGTKM